jgi:hypothetical protein
LTELRRADRDYRTTGDLAAWVRAIKRVNGLMPDSVLESSLDLETFNEELDDEIKELMRTL